MLQVGADGWRQQEQVVELLQAPAAPRAEGWDALLRRAVAPCTAAYSTAHQRLPDSCSASDRPGAGTALRRRGYGALSRERETHERFGRNDPFVTLTFTLGVQPALDTLHSSLHELTVSVVVLSGGLGYCDGC